MSKRRSAPWRAAALVCAFVSFPQNARADVVPPTLTQPALPIDPRTTPMHPEVRVLLELEVDQDGSVRTARVLDSVDSTLEFAALEAGRRLRFTPASRDGNPVRARIRYELSFPAKTAPVATAPPPPPASAAPSVSKATAEPSYDATARVEAPPHEPTKRSIDRDEMSRIAGTRGDPLRAIELLPGVSRPGFDGTPILRGANPQDSQVFIEGAPAPGLYHLGGLASVIHSRVLEGVDLVPSNFSVRYGRKAGGIVEVRLRDARTDRPHAVLDLSLLDSSLVLETPLGDKLAVLGAVRRSNIDAVLNSAVNGADLAITSAPVYWDYQHVTTFRPSARDRLRLLAYGSSDRVALFLKKPADADPAIRGAIESSTVFHRVQLGYRHQFDGGSQVNAELTYGYSAVDVNFGAIARGRGGTNMLQGRAEWSAALSPQLRVTSGLDLLSTHLTGTYSGVAPTTGEGDQPAVVSTQKPVELPQTAVWLHQPGAYLEAAYRPVPRLVLIPGLRADYTGQIRGASLDPRFSTRWEASDSTTLKAGVGRFSQAPLDYTALEGLGNPRLRQTRAVHVSAGVEQALFDGVSASAEGFVKWLDGVVTTTQDGRAPGFVNTQDGRIFGAELMLRVKPRGRFFGFASYTLMRSERKDQGVSWRVFDRDQPHIVSAAGAVRLGRGWEVGASFRLTSGTPYTPVTSSSYDADQDVYRPRRGATMSARNPAFWRADVRIEKKWTFKLWSLAMYLDVQNVLNAPNREGFTYTYDYSARQGVRGLPLFPSLGIRGEL